MVSLYSTIKMMYGPINVRYVDKFVITFTRNFILLAASTK